MLSPRSWGEESETTSAVNFIYIPFDNTEHAVNELV